MDEAVRLMNSVVKPILIQLMIVAAAIATGAQNGSLAGEPRVEVLDQKWSKIAIFQGPDRRTNVFDPSSNLPQTREARTSRVTRYAYEAKIRNTGDQDIRAVTWSYVFTDPVSKQEINRRRFYSVVTIHPHKTKRIEGYTRSVPTSTVSARAEASERVVVECVVLKDGSTVRRQSYTGSCTGVRR